MSHKERDILLRAFSELGDFDTLREPLHPKAQSSEGPQGRGQMSLGLSGYHRSVASTVGMLVYKGKLKTQ